MLLEDIISDRYLAIYLQDHLAGATGGLNLARRAAGSNEGTELGAHLAALADEIEEDRGRLLSIMEHLEVEPDRLKVGGAWVGEKLGRLKLNGQITSYSPLSRLVELEGLYVGITGKLSLWRNLERAMGERLVLFGLPDLIQRAEDQQARVETLRLEVAGDVLAE
jgi:hypothetical protein